MNPVTATLLSRLDLPELSAWIEAWDQLERMLIRVYRQGAVSESQARMYRTLRRDIRGGYEPWREALERHWRAAEAAGERLAGDPFLYLTQDEELAAQRVGWAAIQLLPAAREALNAYLLDRLNQNAEGQ